MPGPDRDGCSWGRAAAALAVCLLVMVLGAAPAGAEEAAWLYDPDTVVELDLGLSEGAIAELAAEPEEYVEGSFRARVGGAQVGPALDRVGIRLKGSSGFRPISGKAALKIRFDEYVKKQTFFGLERLTLNNMAQDPSMLHEVLAYDVFRAMGVPAPRAGYTLTRLNGEVLGVHANIETYDDVSLPKLFESTRHLYEADGPGIDVVAADIEGFEIDEGDEEDVSDLEALIAASAGEEGEWSDRLAPVADLEVMTRMWAVERYVGHWDGYAGGDPPLEIRPNNYYLHSDGGGVFTIAPWGTDQTWVRPLGFDQQAGAVLFDRCIADPGCRAMYDGALADLLALVPTLELDGKAERYAALLAPCRALEVPPRRVHSATVASEAVAATLAFIDARPSALAAYLGVPVPPEPDNEAEPQGHEPCTRLLASAPSPASWSEPPLRAVADRRQIGFGPVRSAGSRISSRLSVPGPGRATIGVRVKRRGRWARGCSATRSARGAGSLWIGCSLGGWASALKRDGAMRVRVRIGFVPRAGSPHSVTRRLTMP
jgi:hypothetical protein